MPFLGPIPALAGYGSPMTRSVPAVRAAGEVIHGDIVGAEDALGRWASCRHAFARSGLWPLLFRLDSFAYDPEFLPDNSAVYDSLDAFSEAVEAFSVERWLDDQRSEPHLDDFLDGDLERFSRYADSDFELIEPGSEYALALLPVDEPWQAAWYLPHFVGNYHHEDLTQLLHGAMLRRWWLAWGAEMVCTNGSSAFELRVDSRPASSEQALELAWEHFFYCPDFDQPTIQQAQRGRQLETVDELAVVLRNSRIWWFWWD